MRLISFQRKREKMSETHMIAHVYGDNNIAKGTPHGPYLRGGDNAIRRSGGYLDGNSYTNANVSEDQHFGSAEHGVIFLPRRLNPNCYSTAKLYEGELCMVRQFSQCQDLSYRTMLSRTYKKKYSCDFLRLCQHTDSMCVESLDEECISVGY